MHIFLYRTVGQWPEAHFCPAIRKISQYMSDEPQARSLRAFYVLRKDKLLIEIMHIFLYRTVEQWPKVHFLFTAVLSLKVLNLCQTNHKRAPNVHVMIKEG